MENKVNLLGVNIESVDLEEAFQRVLKLLPNRKGDFFCLTNIHVVMVCQKDPVLKKVLNQSAVNFPDGKGLAMGLNMLGHPIRFKVRGTDLMLRLCKHASQNRLKIFLYGSSEETLKKLKRSLREKFPGLYIAGAISPPFRPLSEEEDSLIVKAINDTESDFLFVALGAPKQEKWMSNHKGSIKPIQIGVGAAFDFIAGNIKQAPLWMQKAPLEWLHRMPQQKKKTIRRMLLVPPFFLKVFMQSRKKDYKK